MCAGCCATCYLPSFSVPLELYLIGTGPVEADSLIHKPVGEEHGSCPLVGIRRDEHYLLASLASATQTPSFLRLMRVCTCPPQFQTTWGARFRKVDPEA